MQGIKNLTQGPINRQLFNLAMPIMATSFIQMAYSLTDMAWVGRLGSEAVAAVGSVGILTWMSGSISLLNKVGSEVSVGQSIGAQNYEDARCFASHNITIALVIIPLIWALSSLTTTCSLFLNPNASTFFLWLGVVPIVLLTNFICNLAIFHYLLTLEVLQLFFL